MSFGNSRNNESCAWDNLYRTGRIPVIVQFPPRLTIKPGSRVLDIGCGEGYQLSWLCNQFNLEGYGIDISSFAVSESLHYTNIKTVLADASSIPFPDQHFDFVYSLGVFEHFEDIKLYLREAFRVLKPRGRFLITVPNKLSLWTLFARPLMIMTGQFEINHEISFTTSEIRSLLEEMNFSPPRFFKLKFEIHRFDSAFRAAFKTLDNILSRHMPSWSFFLGAVTSKMEIC